MDSWTAIALVVTGGIGALAFLRVVGNEITFQNRLIELRERKARKERKEQKARKEREARRRERKLAAADEDGISTVLPVSQSAEEAT